ncbi:MAG: ArnT family glycosyltransferase [Candidatus Binatia bacterium]
MTLRSSRVDRCIGALLFGATVAYLAVLPHNLGRADEVFFLVEAKRLLHGELMYRDLFWFAGPIAQWCMAIVFAIFGDTMTVARLAAAVLQGGVALLLYGSARRCGVRPELALAPPLLHVAFGVGLWPHASPHWFSTLMMAAILYSLLADGRVARPAGAVLPGVCTGALALSHQHQGAVFALAVLALFGLESAIARRSGHALPPRTWWYACRWYALGTAAVALPGIVFLLATTGATPLIEQTILHPLSGYRHYNRTAWGAVTTGAFALYTWPPLLRWAPFALLPALLRLAAGWRQRRPLAELDRLAVLLLIGIASMVSVAYMPDIVHLGFIAPLLFVAGVEGLEALLHRWSSRPVLARAAAALLAVALLGTVAARSVRTYRLLWRDYPFHAQTAFGGIDFGMAQEVRLIELIDAVMADHPDRLLFAYPTWSPAYLAADTQNPTGHPLFMPDYLPEVEIDRTLAALASKRPPYILVMNFGLVRGDDRILPWVREHYEVERTDTDPSLPYTLYRRRDVPPPSQDGGTGVGRL